MGRKKLRRYITGRLQTVIGLENNSRCFNSKALRNKVLCADDFADYNLSSYRSYFASITNLTAVGKYFL